MPIKGKNIDWKSRLSERKPDDRIWIQIEKELDFNVRLANRMAELPAYNPQQAIWEKIAANLAHKKTVRFKISYISVAASIVEIVLISTILFQIIQNNAYSISEKEKYTQSEVDMEHVAIDEIRKYCNLNKATCDQSDLRELMQLYEELNEEESELKNAIMQLGDSPEMIHAMIKIKNLKSETIQDMILMIQS
ncbi:MAG: hypothetical protein ACK5KP_07470 [Paludibacteraceae bacterium]